MENLMIQTERLVLRPYQSTDAQMMYTNWSGDSEVTKYLTWQAVDSIEAVKKRLDYLLSLSQTADCFHWAIVEKASNEVIGSIDVVEETPAVQAKEIGYVLAKKAWGKGYMTEALAAVVDYLFAFTTVNRIEAHHDAENHGSGRVMAKAGLSYEGTLKQKGLNNRGIVDMCIYGITREMYRLSKE